MKIAVLSTPLNIEIARRFMSQLKQDVQLTHYYRRGNIVLKENREGKTAMYRHPFIKVLQDIRKNMFNQIVITELPFSNLRMLPHFVLLGLFSKAILLQTDGTCIPVTKKLLVQHLIQFASILLKLMVVVPVIFTNLFLLTLSGIIIDLIVFIRSWFKS